MPPPQLPPFVRHGGVPPLRRYTLLSSFILLNLLIAIFNSTYERVSGDRDAEWLWLRLEAMLSFESGAPAARPSHTPSPQWLTPSS